MSTKQVVESEIAELARGVEATKTQEIKRETKTETHKKETSDGTGESTS